MPLSPKERDEWIINEAKLWFDTGSMFDVDGEDFERINVACPRKVLEEGLEAWRRAYEAKRLLIRLVKLFRLGYQIVRIYRGETMPIKVIKNLPAITKLAQENIFVMDTERRKINKSDPLQILLVNLMPTKEVTETQIYVLSVIVHCK